MALTLPGGRVPSPAEDTRTEAGALRAVIHAQREWMRSLRVHVAEAIDHLEAARKDEAEQTLRLAFRLARPSRRSTEMSGDAFYGHGHLEDRDEPPGRPDPEPPERDEEYEAEQRRLAAEEDWRGDRGDR